jgi:OOP family OmpA-OmpF porin
MEKIHRNSQLMKTGLSVIISVILFTIGCATVQEKEKNVALERARAAYSQAQANPDISANAPVAMHEAAQALQKAEQAKDIEETEDLAYLAERQAQLAVAIAERKMAENERERLIKERDKILLEARERELERARSEAEARSLELEQARKEAEAKAQESEMARLQSEEAIAKRKQLESELEELKAKQTERGIVLTLGDILFGTGKDVLMPGAVNTIDKLVKFLEKYQNRNVLIEGHTDSVGSETYNLGLSQRRADAVRAALISKGISENRITAKGYGESRPVASNTTAAGRQQNRRVEIVILGEGISGE